MAICIHVKALKIPNHFLRAYTISQTAQKVRDTLKTNHDNLILIFSNYANFTFEWDIISNFNLILLVLNSIS